MLIAADLPSFRDIAETIISEACGGQIILFSFPNKECWDQWRDIVFQALKNRLNELGEETPLDILSARGDSSPEKQSAEYLGLFIKMETVLGDGSHASGGLLSSALNSAFSAGKRLLTGEKLFVCKFTNEGTKPHTVAFAAPHYGSMLKFDLEDFKQNLVCQKGAFVCADQGVRLGIAFQKRLSVGFLGEGFCLQSLSGRGTAIIHAGGSVVEMSLRPHQRIEVDSSCLVALEGTVQYKMKMVTGVFNIVFGGEGVAISELVGPGRIFLQTTPFSRIADQIIASIPKEK